MARRSGTIVLTYVLAAIVAAIACRVEVLNRAAGDVLPRRERDTASTGQPGKWRASLVTTEERWIEAIGPRDEDGNRIARALTSDDRRKMQQDVARHRANNALRQFVTTWGLAQCLVFVPLLGVASLLIGMGLRKWLLAILPMTIAIAAAWLIVEREYIGSLGW